MPFDDRGLQCVSCGVMFVFSAGEQQFFQEKGFTNEPKHCKQCKAKTEWPRRAASNRNARHLLRVRERHNRPVQTDARQTCIVQNVFRKTDQQHPILCRFTEQLTTLEGVHLLGAILE